MNTSLKVLTCIFVVASATLATTSCKDSDCDKLAAVATTCISRQCTAGGAATALCTCWEHEMVLAGWTAEPCNDGQDNDTDGFTDCEDPDCWASESCQCTDGEDNDGDGLADCDDPDCAGSTACCHLKELAPACCTDGVDNDGDGLTDCEGDPDCAHNTDCCTDGEDNDGDGLTDCQDEACKTSPFCCTSAEDDREACNCDDGVDNDGDGLTDCMDDDCFGLRACWDPRNRYHAEKVPYCVDAVESMEQTCHKDAAAQRLKDFDCTATALRFTSGLPGKYKIGDLSQTIDLSQNGYIDEETSVETSLIRGPDMNGEEQDLKRITFYDDGWFSSNISVGVWEVRTQGGVPTGAVSISFLSDACLDALDLCDVTRPFSWRSGPDGPMFYELQMLPETSVFKLGIWEIADTNADGIDDRILTTIELERQ